VCVCVPPPRITIIFRRGTKKGRGTRRDDDDDEGLNFKQPRTDGVRIYIMVSYIQAYSARDTARVTTAARAGGVLYIIITAGQNV